MFQGILVWVTAHPQAAIAIGLAVYLFATKKLTLSGLFQEIVKDIQNVVTPSPAPGPTPTPGPVPALPDIIAQLIALLQQARQSGDKELESAALKIIDTCPIQKG